MIKTISRVNVLIFLSLSVCAGCSLFKLPNSHTVQKNAVGPISPAAVDEDVSVSTVPIGPRPRDRQEFSSLVLAMLARRDYEGLDAFADSIRANKERFETGGGWKIHSFYLVASSPAEASDVHWAKHIKLLQEWKSATGSITSRTALADAYLRWAWFARGDSYTDEVKDESWPIVIQRMEKARDEILAALAGEARCPEFYLILLSTARAIGDEQEVFDRFFSEAIAYEPEYQYFYTEKAVRLLPRWGGKPGELAQYANELLKSRGPDEGLELYYLIVADLSLYKHDDLFKETGLSWRKTKKGFRLHERKHGASHYRVGEFLRIAWLALDTEAVCNTAKRLPTNADFDPSVFETPDAVRYWQGLGRSACELPKYQNQAL